MQGGSHSLRKLRRDWWKTRLCTSCVSPLGRILSRGGICPQCGLRVCKDCRSELQPPGTGAWVCVLCSSGGMSSDNLAKGSKNLGRDSRSIRRSWTISNPQRAQTNSPILKSYTVLHPEDSGNALSSPGSNNSNNVSTGGTPASHQRQFHSLPRMSSETERSKKVKRSFNSEFEKENIKRHRSFQTTLHPYQAGNPPSPSASINFIEDPFWDYYDYEIDSPSGSPKSASRIHRLSSARSAGLIMSRRNPSIRKRDMEMDKLLHIRTNSNRSSCERSLGESVDYDFSLKTMNNFNSLSDTELNENSKYDSPSQEQLSPRRFSTESSNNFYRFATITPINMSPLNDCRQDNVNKLYNPHNIQQLLQRSPVKPERTRGPSKNRRSMSLNSYDGKKLFSPLRTYCVLMKENVVPKTNNISNAHVDATTESNCNNSTANLNTNGKNTSSVFINPSSSNIPAGAEVNSNLNAARFHSLPRERVIRIEREDGKFARPGTNGNHEDRSRNKNNRKTSIVEISRSSSSASAVTPSPGKNTTRVPITNGGNNAKIQRSQSYREISSSKPQVGGHEVPSVINVRLEKSSSPYSSQSSGNATLPLSGSRENKEPYQRPYFDSILDDKNSISVMENFLRNQKAKSRESRNNEKPSKMVSKDSPNKSDYIQSHMSDFEAFQRQQIQTFDNYLRQCSSLPRATGKGAWSMQNQLNNHQQQSQKPVGAKLIGSEPKHVSKTTISDDNLRKFDDLDAYFHPLNNNDISKSHDHNERILPIVVVNGSNTGSAGWSATLPHPYIRRHKQQKTSFVEQSVPSVDNKEKNPSPSINEIEQEIERDIYFQKTKSLDRHRPSKQNSSTFISFVPAAIQSTDPNESTPPIASPRLKRKAKLASNPNLSSPKINTEQSQPQEYVSGLGTNYPKNQVQSSSTLNKNNSRLPIEPVQTSDNFKQYPITTAAISHTNTNNTTSSSGLKNMPVPIVPTSSHESLSKMHKDIILESQSKVSHPSYLSPSEIKMKSGNLTANSNNNSNFDIKSASNSAFTGADLDADSELKLFSRSSLSSLSLNQNHNAHLHKDEAQQVLEASEPPPPIATPRARRKNSNQLRYNNEQEDHEVGSHNNNFNNSPTQRQNQSQSHQDSAPIQCGDTSKSQSNLPKAVRFEPHVIEMEMENERKHNQAKAANNNFNVMRMNNKLRQHLVTSPLPVSSSHHNQTQPGAQIYAKQNARNKGNVHHYISGTPLGLGNKKSHIYQYHYHHGGVKSSKASNSDKKQRSQAYGFVARAIAKVKGKAKGKSISGKPRSSSPSGSSGSGGTAPITDINTSSGIQSVETRDSITYISPPPTQQQQGDITPILLPHSQSSNVNGNGNGVGNNSGISRAESFNKGVIKHEAEERNSKHSIMQEAHIQNQNPTQPKSISDLSSTTKANHLDLGITSQSHPPQELKSILSSPTKPKRSPNIMDPLNNLNNQLLTKTQGKSTIYQPAVIVEDKNNKEGMDQQSRNDQFHGLISDQLTPSSSSSSSSSSYLSNLQESYDFFHESEECESIPDEEARIAPNTDLDLVADESDDDDQEGVFKSFEDDEDAGEDFIFYAKQPHDTDDEERKRTSHAYNGPANPNATGISGNINAITGSNLSQSSGSTTSSGSSSNNTNTTSKGIPIPKPVRNSTHSSLLHHQQQEERINNHKTFIGGDYHKKGEDKTKKELRNSTVVLGNNKKGLAIEQVDLEDNGMDGNQHLRHPQHQHLKTYRVDDSHPQKSLQNHKNNFNKDFNEQVPRTSRLSDLSQKAHLGSEHVDERESRISQHQQYQHHAIATSPTAKGISYNNNNSNNSHQPVVVVEEEVPQAKTFAYNNKQKDHECVLLDELQQSQKSQSQKSTRPPHQYVTNNTIPSPNSSPSSTSSLGSSRPKGSSLPLEEGHFILNPKFKLPKPNNLLLPSSFIKSSTLPGKNSNSFQNFNQSEFFPGEDLKSSGGMSLCGDLAEGSGTSHSQNPGRFKSRVLVNPSESEESRNSPVLSSDVVGVLKKGSSNSKVVQGSGKKNVTRVDISGDVGIVTTNTNAENAFLKDRRAQLKKTNENLWMNDVYSSGLTQLSNQNQTNEDDNDSTVNNNIIESKYSDEVNSTYSTTSLENNVGSFDEAGSSVSQNGSGSSSGSGSTISDDKIGSSDNVTLTGSSEDGSSDWHSESTKNTVIFRGGDPNHLSNTSKQWPPSPGDIDIVEGGVFNYNCDPEIHISSITLVDNATGSSVTSPLASEPTTTPIIKPDTTNTSNIAKAETNDAREITHKSSDDKDKDNRKNVKSLLDNTESISSINKFDGSQDGSRNLSTVLADCPEELGKSNETLTEDYHEHLDPIIQMPEDLNEIEMVQNHPVARGPNQKSALQYIPSNSNNSNNKTSAFHQRRESPEGQEQEIPSSHPDKDTNLNKVSKKVLGVNEVIIMEEKDNGSSGQGKISKSKISQNALSQITSASSRSSPDGADAERSEGDTTEPDNDSPTPIEHFDVTSDEDSWADEISFEEEYSSVNACRKQQPPPLDLTLHTIVEESCEESEAENSDNFNQQPSTSQRRHVHSQQNDNELEKYFNFGIYNENNSQGGRNSLTNEESEFSDTFSESSFSLHDDELGQGSLKKPDGKGSIDPAELASTRLEKYFYNLGLPQSMLNPISSINQTADSDSVGSESESDNSVLEKRKKVLRHHRRSADFEDEFGDKVSDEEEDFGFGQDGFDTIKKTGRKVKKSGSENNLLECATGGNSKSSENLIVGGASAAENIVASSLISHKDKAPLEKSLSAGGTSSSSKEGSSSASPTSPSSSRKSKTGDKPVIKVSRSNSFTWSSDEEVNIMMSKFRQLIKNLIKSKMDSNAAEATSNSSGAQSASTGNAKDKDKQLAYLENELIRLMKSDNLKSMVEYLSSEDSDVDDVYKFIRVVKESGSISNPEDSSDLDLGDLDLEDPNLFQTLHTTMQTGNASNISPKGSPALLAKVMHHIGNRLAVWMKDENLQEDDNNDDSVTLKCAQSVSSDLNEDRFSWKGSFESALAAKRQSVGSTDSISSSDFTQDRSILRSSSLHHLANSSHHLGQVEEHKEEEETASSLPRMTNLCNSLPRLNQPSNLAISRAHSLVMHGRSEGEPDGGGPVKSARYRPPGFQPVKSKRMDDEGTNSPILSQSTPVLTQDPGNLKVRSDSMGSIFHDTKPHISVKGQVEFGLQYNYKLACLEVRVKQCRDLAAVDNKRNRSDPYVKAYLLPDRSKNGKRKTKTKKNTLNPVFDEILKFPLTLSDLQNRTLWLSVWHSDIFGKNEFLGEVLVDLKDRVFDETNPQSWDLQEMSGQMEDVPRGDVVIALKWQPKTENTGNLSVLVKEAKNVASVKTATPSTFVKCTMLTDKSRKQKSSICRRSSNPVWNQTMNFEDVDNDGIEITVWNHDLLSNHDLLGTVRIDYDSPIWESMLSRHSFWVEGGLRLN